MSRQFTSRFLCCLIGCALVPIVASAAEGESKPLLFNPFAKRSDDAPNEQPPAKKSNRITMRVTDDTEPAESGFKWPTLPKPKLPPLPKLNFPKWGGEEAPPSRKTMARQSEEPSAWQKLNVGTKDFLGKTKDTLMPWTKSDPEPTARSLSSAPRRTSRSMPHGRTKTASSEKKPFYSSWLGKSEEPERVETVNDFLAQPRP